jgi:uncharacterized protein YndB with AHSA1/START domain
MTKNKTVVTAEPGKQDILITREFDAPRELVFKTYTDPKLISQWWGPREVTTIVDKLEAKKGGMWRFVHQAQDGEYAFNGVFHDVVSPERIVQTFEFEPMPGHVLLETITFEDQGDKTRLISQSVFQSVEDRDGMLQSGMESGAAESNDRLDELLEKMQK